jgi:hypothetical protein
LKRDIIMPIGVKDERQNWHCHFAEVILSFFIIIIPKYALIRFFGTNGHQYTRI